MCFVARHSALNGQPAEALDVESYEDLRRLLTLQVPSTTRQEVRDALRSAAAAAGSGCFYAAEDLEFLLVAHEMACLADLGKRPSDIVLPASPDGRERVVQADRLSLAARIGEHEALNHATTTAALCARCSPQSDKDGHELWTNCACDQVLHPALRPLNARDSVPISGLARDAIVARHHQMTQRSSRHTNSTFKADLLASIPLRPTASLCYLAAAGASMLVAEGCRHASRFGAESEGRQQAPAPAATKTRR